MILNYFIDNLLPILIAIGGGVGWIYDRNKRKAEYQSILATNKQAEATALQGMQDVYDKFVEDVKLQIETLRQENSELKSRIKELEQELSASSKERSKLSDRIDEYKAQTEKDSKLIIQLKKKVESYESELKSFRKERL